MTVLMLLFVISYYSIILEGPGYLPFYYPLKMAKRKGNHSDYLAGVVSTKMQEAYVSGQKVPTRVNYFKSARRYVIRPDHFCGWTGSFIGKKNHKLFFTFNFWGSIYIALFTIFSYFSVRVQTNIFNNNAFFLAISIIYILLGLFFFLMTFNFAILSLVRFANNKTQFELMKKQEGHPFRRSCIENFEDVCGPRKYMFLWLFPIGAFHGVPDEDLLYASTTVDIL
ncbi:cysteine S-palmitoyltransferase protein [Trichomonas vaginalis G3]|uniref:cysteine S-palmitoyltransferase protein n=1 Tax=Trichomonas vaginalis (strain ATCC PRA-98 / G3) TaxID=412133 RepID=UPI0021E54624|nr:cysteine S-palmitoyltransferase protein [Trichomonas vaginalis G3]KAI5528905.1 cysteine S-palmitoyltransferase protein [Trichomonas vaginalis G3]